MVRTLGAIDRDVDIPQIERGLAAPGSPEFQRLVRILGADGHHVAIARLSCRAFTEHELLTQRLPAGGAFERVIGFHPGLALPHAEKQCLDPAHQAPVQELMVHIHQILVHESVMAVDAAFEIACLVVWIGRRRHVGKRHDMRPIRVTRKHEHEPIGFARRVAAHAVRFHRAGVEIRNADALAVGAVFPAVIATADRACRDNADMQRHLAVGAAVFESEQLAVFASHDDDRLAGKARSVGLAGFDVARARYRIPEIGIDRGLADIARRLARGAVGQANGIVGGHDDRDRILRVFAIVGANTVAARASCQKSPASRPAARVMPSSCAAATCASVSSPTAITGGATSRQRKPVTMR